MYVALWALAAASTVTVVQRIWVVRRQAITATGDGATHG
jgi:CDP-diacylglycerol--glycerol-3-phosphate 3-phosphatidyltransferase/CDP-diacylglycerol--inositol 3-phosphatidyltransferase